MECRKSKSHCGVRRMQIRGTSDLYVYDVADAGFGGADLPTMNASIM